MAPIAGLQADTAVVRDLRGFFVVRGDPEKIARLTAQAERRFPWLHANVCLGWLAMMAMELSQSHWLTGAWQASVAGMWVVAIPGVAYHRSLHALEDRLGKFKRRVSRAEIERLQLSRTLDIRWFQTSSLAIMLTGCGLSIAHVIVSR